MSAAPACYRERVISSRGQPVGAFHSRTTENSIAAANKINTKVLERILFKPLLSNDGASNPVWQARRAAIKHEIRSDR